MTKTKMRVLAAEDSPTQAAVLRGHLEHAGFEVAVATNGAEALKLMAEQSFDLVVSDIVMPDVDGYELCRSVKERSPSVPVVLLTSLSDPLDVVNALSAGADNFVRKPYEAEDLVHRIGNMLHNKQLRESGRAQMGLELFFLGRRFMVNADPEQILDLLVSTFEDLVDVNRRLRAREEDLAVAHDELAAQLHDTAVERDRLQAVLGSMPAGVAVFDTDGRIISANDKLAQIVDVPSAQLHGAVVWDVVAFDDHAGDPLARDERALAQTLGQGHGAVRGSAFDLLVRRRDGTRVPVVARSEPIRDVDGCVVGAVGTLEDLSSLMDHDPVTGLPGHGILVDRLGAAAELGQKTGLAVVTIDRFDLLRHGVPGSGDHVMSTVAGWLDRGLLSTEVERRSPAASAASLGNGELAVILPGIQAEADAIVVGQLLKDQLCGYVEMDGVEVPVTVSIAVGMCDDAPNVAAQIASVAASARRASAEGGDRVAASDESLHSDVLEFLRRENELRTAISAHQLVVHYQPQVDIRDGRPVAVEALVRWQHPTRGLLGAQEIIPLAVESGLIAALGWTVLEQACRQGAQWHDTIRDGRPPVLSVNLAAEQLAEDDVVTRIERILHDTGFDPTSLILEITEGSVMADATTASERLAAIKALGVRIAIDDFGTGYSSLLQLRRLPIDVLKVDRCFVNGMLDEPADAAIVASIARLARALGLEVVAEGVETMDQLVQLRMLRFDLGQGHHWARAMPAEELTAWWSTMSAGPQLDDGNGTAPTDPDEEHDEVISYLVHELRTPLVAITGFAELLQESADRDVPDDFVDAIVRNARELDKLLASLHEANDVLRGGLHIVPEDRDLAALVETLVHDLSLDLAPHLLEFSSDGTAIASVDASRLTQVVGNLLTNAAKFTPAERSIEVAVSTTDEVVEISVRDHGPGVPQERVHELFRRFSRLGATAKGMGLGLYLSNLIVEAHGGVLRYDDAPGGGAAFTIRLPKRASVDGAPERRGRRGSPTTQASIQGRDGRSAAHTLPAASNATCLPPRSWTVVCVEDDASTTELIARVLATRPGVHVLSAPDGCSGLQLARERHPDVVLLDLNVGGLGGEEVLRALRSRPDTAAIPVVILSGDSDESVRADLLAAGAHAVVTKPFRPQQLRSVVDTILDGDGQVPVTRSADPTPAPAGIVLDPDMIRALEELDKLSGDCAGIAALVRLAFADGQHRLRALEGAASDGRLDDIVREAHALRGAMGNLGAQLVVERCDQLASTVRTNEVDRLHAEVEALAAEVEAAHHALVSHFP